tara:strand:+ start:15262 stop:16551 length:1290 start_codon:yes stop_codon:yes gene_type:complete
VLALSTLLTLYSKLKTNTFSLSIPVWIMLLWLFKGGVDFSIAEIAGVDLRYESELFPIKVDLDYLLAYLTYFLYFLSYCTVCILYFISSKKVSGEFVNVDFLRSKFNLKPLFLLSTVTVVLYLYYGINMYRESLGSGLSIYHYSRFNGGTSKSLMTLISWIGLASCILGIGIATKRNRIIFIFLLLSIFLISGILGNRHILLSGMILYFVLFLDTKKYSILSFLKMVAVFVLILSSIMSIYVVREAQEGDFDSVNPEKVQTSIVNMFSSSEFIYSHMSMYGVYSNEIEVSVGKSLFFLVSATLPRVISNDREEDIYNYYIQQVSSNPFKGFTIANPTGWYLNFGIVGVFFGGCILGLICCSLHFCCYHNRKQSMFFILVFSLFLSDIIGYMRSGGPEPLRAVLLIKAILPAIIIITVMKFKFRFRMRPR